MAFIHTLNGLGANLSFNQSVSERSKNANRVYLHTCFYLPRIFMDQLVVWWRVFTTRNGAGICNAELSLSRIGKLFLFQAHQTIKRFTCTDSVISGFKYLAVYAIQKWCFNI